VAGQQSLSARALNYMLVWDRIGRFECLLRLSFRAQRGISLWSGAVGAKAEERIRARFLAVTKMIVPKAPWSAVASATAFVWNPRRQLRCRTPRRFAHLHARWWAEGSWQSALGMAGGSGRAVFWHPRMERFLNEIYPFRSDQRIACRSQSYLLSKGFPEKSRRGLHGLCELGDLRCSQRGERSPEEKRDGPLASTHHC
jgi:hypothetical protein